MSATTEHEVEMEIIRAEGENDILVCQGTRFGETYFEFSVDLPLDPWHPAKEVADEQLLDHLLRAGCFDWLLDPAENNYTLDDGEPL